MEMDLKKKFVSCYEEYPKRYEEMLKGRRAKLLPLGSSPPLLGSLGFSGLLRAMEMDLKKVVSCDEYLKRYEEMLKGRRAKLLELVDGLNEVERNLAGSKDKEEMQANAINSIKRDCIAIKQQCDSLSQRLVEVERQVEKDLETEKKLKEECETMEATNKSLKEMISTIKASISESESLQKEKQELSINLPTAEEMFKVISQNYDILNEEYSRVEEQFLAGLDEKLPKISSSEMEAFIAGVESLRKEQEESAFSLQTVEEKIDEMLQNCLKKEQNDQAQASRSIQSETTADKGKGAVIRRSCSLDSE